MRNSAKRVLVMAARDDVGALRRAVLPLSRIQDIDNEYSVHVTDQATVSQIEQCDILVMHGYVGASAVNIMMTAQTAGAAVVLDLAQDPEPIPTRSEGMLVAAVRPYFELAMSNADALVVSSERLARRVRPYNEHVFVNQTYVDETIWKVGAHEPTDAAQRDITIAWPARTFDVGEYALVADALERLSKRRERRVTILHFAGRPLPGIPAFRQRVHSPMPYIDMPDALGDAHIAVVPRVRDKTSDMGTGETVLEMGALGLPVVASATRPHEELAGACADLSLASSNDEWLRSLTCLVGDSRLRIAAGESLLRCSQAHAVGAHLSSYVEALEFALAAARTRDV